MKSPPEILNPDSPPRPPLASPPSVWCAVFSCEMWDVRINIRENPGLCVAVMKLYLSPGTSSTWTIGLVAEGVGHLPLGDRPANNKFLQIITTKIVSHVKILSPQMRKKYQTK